MKFLESILLSITRFIVDRILSSGFRGASKDAKSEYQRSLISVIHSSGGSASAKRVSDALNNAGFKADMVLVKQNNGDNEWQRAASKSAGIFLVEESIPDELPRTFHDFSIEHGGQVCAVVTIAPKPKHIELESHFNHGQLPEGDALCQAFCVSLIARSSLARLIHRERSRLTVSTRLIVILAVSALAMAVAGCMAGYFNGRHMLLEAIRKGQNYIAGLDAAEVRMIDGNRETRKILRTASGDINYPETAVIEARGHRLALIDIEFLDVITEREHSPDAFCPKRGEHGSESAYISSRRKRLFGGVGETAPSIWQRIQAWDAVEIDRERDSQDVVSVVCSILVTGQACSKWKVSSRGDNRGVDVVGGQHWLLVRPGDTLLYDDERVAIIDTLSRAVEERVCGLARKTPQ